jgi:hypothetical protein
MLTLAEVRNTAGSLLSLQLNDVTDGFVLKEIKGLDPVNAVLVSSDYAQQDGAQFHSARRLTRNIIFVLSLEPERSTTPTTVKTLRNQLYSYFMPKSPVDLRFIDSEGLTVTITGRVETFETPLFSPESTVSISILCFDPDLVKLTSETITGDTVSDTTETLVTYDGTVETGIVFVLNVDRTEDAFTIYHRKPSGELVSMDFAGSLVNTDVVTINTITGSKGAVLTHSSVDSSVLYGISAQSTWIELEPGDNYIRIYATGAAIPWEITYTKRYGGL